jgi:hypothetical protein
MGRHCKYPLADIEVGGSLDFPVSGSRVPVAGGARTRDRIAQSLSDMVYAQKKRHGRVFTIRELPQLGVVRVWRLA